MDYNQVWKGLLDEYRLEVIVQFDDVFIDKLYRIEIEKYEYETINRRITECITFSLFDETFESSRVRWITSGFNTAAGTEYNDLTAWGLLKVPLEYEELLYFRNLFNLLSSRIQKKFEIQ